MAIEIKTITTDNHLYNGMLQFRNQVLLRPIGIPLSYIQPEEEKKDLLIIAVEDEKVVGCCVLTQRSKDTVQLRQMAVDDALQQTGLGRKIVAFAENTAAETGYKILFLNARDVVIPFYLKCGYEVIGEGFTEVSIPHHRMQKALLKT